MRRWAMGALLAGAVLVAVVLICGQPAEAARVHVHVGAYVPGYYYPYSVRYRPRFVAPPVWVGPPVRVYAYPPPVVYGPPAYVPVPPPPALPCPRYRVWEW